MFNGPHEKGKGPVVKFTVETVFVCFTFFLGLLRKLKFRRLNWFRRLFLRLGFLKGVIGVAFLNLLSKIFLRVNIVTDEWRSDFFVP